MTAEKKIEFEKRAVLLFVTFIAAGAMMWQEPTTVIFPFCIPKIIPTWGAKRRKERK